MPCACQSGKNTKLVTIYTPDIWGPPLWKLLHILASRLGSTDPLLNTDCANTFHILLNKLPTILPCMDCQRHAKAYLLANKFDPRNRPDLRLYSQTYLFRFHNAVRTMLGKPLLFNTVEEVKLYYASQVFSAAENTNLAQTLSSGVQLRYVSRDALTMWNTHVSRLRSIIGV